MCNHEQFIISLGEPQSNREYWIMTEIFVYLHGGKDYCTCKPKYRDENGNFKSLYRMFCDDPGWAMNMYKNLEEENKRLKDLLRKVGFSGVDLDDERLHYITIQVHRTTWNELQKMI